MDDEPLVSVICITYNHEKYIRDAIEGLLIQKTRFPIEIYIHDDCSTDATPGIIQEYAAKHYKLIKPIYQSVNQYSLGKKITPIVLPYCKGKYIALCEGDDYWTDPYKLQKQSDFLEKHPECALCFHAVEIISEIADQGAKIATPHKKKSIYTLKDLLKGNFIHTCSVMFRRGLFGEFPDWFYKAATADWPLHILNAQYGDIGYINEIMGAYRVHSGGIHSSKGEMEQVKGMIEIYPHINAHLNYKYSFPIKLRIYFKLIEKKIGMALQSLKLGRIVTMYRKIFYE
jgi:glycosyltransferase involved in cell wall biosynthesis